MCFYCFFSLLFLLGQLDVVPGPHVACRPLSELSWSRLNVTKLKVMCCCCGLNLSSTRPADKCPEPQCSKTIHTRTDVMLWGGKKSCISSDTIFCLCAHKSRSLNLISKFICAHKKCAIIWFRYWPRPCLNSPLGPTPPFCAYPCRVVCRISFGDRGEVVIWPSEPSFFRCRLQT